MKTNHIIYAWRSGEYQKEDLNVAQQTQTFRKYLGLLDQMSREQPNMLDAICGEIYTRCR
jgi:hypothetical protein